MDKNLKRAQRKTIRIVFYTRHLLLGQCLRLILESQADLEIVGTVATSSELIEVIEKERPEVALFCLLENESDEFEVMSEVTRVSPDTKGLILSPLDSSFDQTRALKLGATGIVGANQRNEVLIRAIRQVADGEVFLNQKLIARLVGNYSNGTALNGNNSKDADLTAREYEVISAIACGLNNKDISKRLFISEATVRHHLSSIYSKLYVEDRLNLVIYAFQNNIVQGQDNED